MAALSTLGVLVAPTPALYSAAFPPAQLRATALPGSQDATGTPLPGYLLTHGARLLLLGGDRQTLAAVEDGYDNPATVPFQTADGAQHDIPVVASFLPFQSASGAVANIAVI